MSAKLPAMKTTNVEVVHKESKGSIIVEHSDGEKESLITNLPDVQKGHKGKVIEVDGMRLFLREPYKGD